MALTTTQNYLGKCKECDYVIFATASDVQDAEGFREVTGGTGVYRVGNNGCFARCTNRHKVFPCKIVKGTYSQDHKCDSRCLNAKGWDCTCSCGGANHGRGHVATVVQAAELHAIEKGNAIARRHGVPEEIAPRSPSTDQFYNEMRAARTVGPLISGATLAPIAPAPAARKHLGTPGDHITGEVFVKTVKSLANGSVLYSFRTVNGGHIIKWFAPGYADPSFEVGSTHKIRAKVKSHGEFNGTPETVVTYVEEVE
jgi:hypothetical protein